MPAKLIVARPRRPANAIAWPLVAAVLPAATKVASDVVTSPTDTKAIVSQRGNDRLSRSLSRRIVSIQLARDTLSLSSRQTILRDIDRTRFEPSLPLWGENRQFLDT